MGKRGIVSIFSRLVDAPSPGAGGGSASPPWPWPSCGSNPQTTSFRAADQGPCCTTAAGGPGSGTAAAAAAASAKLRGAAAAGEMYKTVNSVYFDPAEEFSIDGEEEHFGEALDLDEDGFSTTTASEWSEAVIRSLGRSSTGRFFVDPASNSILATAASSPAREPAAEVKPAAAAPDPDPEDSDDEKQEACTSTSPLAKGSVAVAVDSDDPYRDFRESMEEMVAAHGLRDWAALEELLAWYLRINDKHNHALIVGAFVDLLLGLTSPSSATAATTTTTATTTTSSASSSSASTGSSTTSSTSIIAATTTAATGAGAMGQCGSGIEAACSSASSSSEPGDVAEEKEREGQ